MTRYNKETPFFVKVALDKRSPENGAPLKKPHVSPIAQRVTLKDSRSSVSDGKKSSCNMGNLDLIPGSERSPGEGNSYPLQYSCLEIPWTEELGGLQYIRSHVERD